ncbi:MAG: hypothetical protein ABJ308_11415 [Halieaceae bacterium]
MSSSDSRAIRVELITSETISKTLAGKLDATKDKEDLVKKLIFYKSMGFVETLRELGVTVLPSPLIYEEIEDYLRAVKKDRYFLYSSRMLALSPLIDSEAEQRELSTRIETLNTILFQNLRYRLERSNLDHQSIRAASNQIMFEMVKNIYQHSSAPARDRPQGFACAQINKLPLVELDDARADIDIVYAALETQKERTKYRVFRWLSISVNDFGIGIPKKLRTHFGNFPPPQCYGRFEQIDSDFVSDDEKLILLASTTGFSTKTISSPSEESFESQEGQTRLARRGYGLVFSLGFIAKSIGRMRIRSQSSEVTISALPERSINPDLWSNIETIAEQLESNFESNFIVETRQLDALESAFPGTQVIIEIPIEAQTYGPTS